MRSRHISSFLGGAWFVGLLFAVGAPAQVSSERLDASKSRLAQMKTLYEKLPPLHQMLLDGNKNAVHLAEVWDKITPGMKKAVPARPKSLREEGAASLSAPAFGVTPVSDPSTDLDFSSFGGFTESETHSAWCGGHVVVGFNDSGSVFETALTGTGAMSFSGVALSTDQGRTFRDLGPVNPGTDPNNFLLGDPLIACADSNTFYYSQILATTGPISAPIAAIGISKSVDGGATWADPIVAAGKDGTAHFLDKDWMAVDPSNPKRVYVTYTDFDASGFSGSKVCPNDFRTGIEFVVSNDGGAHWGKPRVIDQICGGANALQGSQVVVGATGQVNFAWEAFVNFPAGPREIRTRAFDAGKGTLSPIVTVDKVVGGGDEFMLQGGFRDFLGMAMAVDRSDTTSNGILYIVWDDGRNKTVPDILSSTGSYSYDDVLLKMSFDGGMSWVFSPTRVNSDVQPRLALGHDHYQPGIAVDKTGKVAVCWYDRREDPENFAISRFCATSTDDGFTWKNTQVNIPAFAPVHGIDLLVNPVYMGDYDGITSDFTHANVGFIGAFQFMSSTANPDVFATKFD